MVNTALNTKVGQIAEKVVFRDEMHKEFFLTYLPKCRYVDAYHAALIYCLGIDVDTRRNVSKIYDFKGGNVKTECLHSGWVTSGSAKIIRIAMNLYNNGTPSVLDYQDVEEQLSECRQYTVDNLFCCGYAKYFWQAVKVRYPEYC